MAASPTPTGARPSHWPPEVYSEVPVQARQPPVHCGWGAPAVHCRGTLRSVSCRPPAAQSNRPRESERAGRGLTCPPRPHPSRRSRPKAKAHPRGGPTGPRNPLHSPIGRSPVSHTAPPLGPAPATGAIRRASRPAHSLAAGNCLSRGWPRPLWGADPERPGRTSLACGAATRRDVLQPGSARGEICLATGEAGL